MADIVQLLWVIMKVKLLNDLKSGNELFQCYVKNNIPVLVKGYAKNWAAFKKWEVRYFKNKYGGDIITTKNFRDKDNIQLERLSLAEYIESIERFEINNQETRPNYWHDVPIFQAYSDLVDDVLGFDITLLPKFYQREWYKYVQFFMSPDGSVTSLHFDTLRTHNLFFQLKGTKKWIILPPKDMKYCNVRDWRWFDVDPEYPDMDMYPQYQNASAETVIVEPGDLFYIPPGTLHKVSSVGTCISFNVDFHTIASVLDSFRYIHRGMPRKVAYYNSIILMALVGRIPSKVIFPFYKSYLNYVS